MNTATAGIARLPPLMPTKVFTISDSVYAAVVYCTRPGPQEIQSGGAFGGWGGCYMEQEIPQTSVCKADEAVCGEAALRTRSLTSVRPVPGD